MTENDSHTSRHLFQSTYHPRAHHPFSDVRSSNKSESDSRFARTMTYQALTNATPAWNAIKPGQRLASPPCIDCPESSVSGEITSLCTDRCVVIACDDPDHGEMSCHGNAEHAHCDLICDGAKNCTDCNGFDEFLQCCTDYHSYLSEPKHPAEIGNTTFAWDPSFDEFLCACSDQTPSTHSKTPVNLTITSSPHGAAKPSFSSFDDRLVFPEVLPPTSSPTPYSVNTTVQTSPILTQQSPMLTCMWGNCQATFPSLTELVGHVNLQHLRLPVAVPSAAPTITETAPSNQLDNLPESCLWRDCNISPCTQLPSQTQADDRLGVLASHLLQDHLGFTAPLPVPAFPDQSPLPSTDIEAQNSTVDPLSPEPSSSHSNSPSNDHECAGTHKCHWMDCGQSFSSCDGLTSHLTADHVGSGKARYECHWEGCNRHSDHGFSSKQKICRHLQSHTGHRPFQCKLCQQNFSEAATLQQHMRRHTQEKPYICDYPGCGKSFAITGALTIHKRTHNGHKPFKCTYCDRAFAESSNLSKHLRTHTGARPYSCLEPGCTKAFARPDQLTRHGTVHKKK